MTNIFRALTPEEQIGEEGIVDIKQPDADAVFMYRKNQWEQQNTITKTPHCGTCAREAYNREKKALSEKMNYEGQQITGNSKVFIDFAKNFDFSKYEGDDLFEVEFAKESWEHIFINMNKIYAHIGNEISLKCKASSPQKPHRRAEIVPGSMWEKWKEEHKKLLKGISKLPKNPDVTADIVGSTATLRTQES